MGKQKNKNKKKDMYEQYDQKRPNKPNKPARDYSGDDKFAGRDNPHYVPERREKKDRPPVEYSPIAIAIRDALVQQINEFHENLKTMSPGDAAKSLLYLPNYPSELTGCPGADQYELYQLERSAFPSKKNPDILSPSTIIVVLDKKTRMPAFLVKVFMVHQDDGTYRSNIAIYEQGERGTIYNRTLRHVV